MARGTELSALPLYPEPYDRLTRLELEGHAFYLARYRADWLDPLRHDSHVKLAAFPATIDNYTASAGNKPKQELEQALAFFDHFYFAFYPDPVRRLRLVRLIAIAR